MLNKMLINVYTFSRYVMYFMKYKEKLLLAICSVIPALPLALQQYNCLCSK